MEKCNEKNYIVSNAKDKLILAKKRNKIQNTCFLTSAEKVIIEKELERTKRRKLLFLWRL